MPNPCETHVSCPKCGHEIGLTAAAQLQAEHLGVSCCCPGCSCEWIHEEEKQSDRPVSNHPVSGQTNVLTDTKNAAPQNVPTVSGEPTVYVVDDDPAIRDSLKCLLSTAGLNVELYHSAEEFLRRCQIERPGCLLLDLHMPGISGIELQQQLRRMRCTIPVIIMTGRGDIPTTVQALKNGAFDFFEKPVDALLLVSRIQQAIEHDVENQRERIPEADSPSLNRLNDVDNFQRMPALLASQSTRLRADAPVS